jgi:anti-anti-sigma factor
VVVRVTGESDLSTAGLLADALAQAAGLGTDAVVVDVAAVRFWDCSGLHALADVTARLRAADRQCRIVGATAPARQLIAMAAFTGALDLDGPVDAAAAALVRPRRRRASGYAATVRARPAEVVLAGRRWR